MKSLKVPQITSRDRLNTEARFLGISWKQKHINNVNYLMNFRTELVEIIILIPAVHQWQ